MKTIKLVSLLFSAALIVGACSPCKECNDKLKVSEVKFHTSDSLLTIKQAESDSLKQLIASSTYQQQATGEEIKALCNPPRDFLLSDYTFTYNQTTFRIEAKPKAGGTTCEIPVPVLNNYLKVSISGGRMYFASASPPPLALMATVTNTGIGDPADIDIVKNNYKHPDNTWASDVYKIIGADDGRNINNPTPPGGQMAYANIEESPVFLSRNSFGTSFTIKQANGSYLNEQNHTMLSGTGYQAKKEKEDKE